MPYIMTAERHGFCCKFWGTVSSKEFMQFNMDLYEHPRFENFRYHLFDGQKVTDVTVEPEDIVKLASYDRGAAVLRPDVRIALVSNNERVLSLLELYQQQIHDTSWVGRCFESMKEARSWCTSRKVELPA